MNTRYVIDANVLMSILISGKSQYLNMLSLFNFILPDFAFIELNLYSDVIVRKSKLDQFQFRQYTYTVFSMLQFYPSFIQEKDSTHKAVKLCESIDNKDIAYVALAIDTNLPLLTRDQRLYKGLRKKSFKQIELFENFIKLL